MSLWQGKIYINEIRHRFLKEFNILGSLEYSTKTEVKKRERIQTTNTYE